MEPSVILKEVQQQQFKPLYFLHGEESYYIDMLAEEIQKHALQDHERDFNQTILYGKDVDLLALISEWPVLYIRAFPPAARMAGAKR